MKETYVCKHCKVITPRKELNSKGWKICRVCLSKFQKAYREKNKDRLKEMNRRYREENKQSISFQRSQYRKANSDKLKAGRKRCWEKNGKKYSASHYQYKKQRLKTDIQFKLRETIRARIFAAVKNGAKSGSAIKLLGCSIEEFKSYIEQQFKPGMNWSNWCLDGWHIDHIKPIKNFDLTDPKQMAEVCHYTNMRPLWAKENLARRFEMLELEDKKPLG